MRQDVAAELARVSKKTRHTSYEQTNTRLTHNNNAAEHRCSGWCVGNGNMRLALPWTSWRGRVSIERSKQRVDCRLGHATPRSTPVTVVDGLRRSARNLECRCTHRVSPRERPRVRHSACARDVWRRGPGERGRLDWAVGRGAGYSPGEDAALRGYP